MSPGSLLFIVCTLICLFGALVVVLSSNPIRSAMGLLATIIGIAGLFLRLDAQFLAAMQLLVYAGAIVILFVFVIMLLGSSSNSDAGPGRARLSRYLAGSVMGLFGLLGLDAVWNGTDVAFPIIESGHGSVDAVGRRIFVDGLVPFELATALLIVAVIGAIAVARGTPKPKKEAKFDHPTKKFFHGALMDRDAVQPLGPTGTLAGTVAATSAAAGEENA